MNYSGWLQTGKRMVQSFKDQWPADIELIVYAEGFNPGDSVTVRELPEWQTAFKDRNKNRLRHTGQTATRYDFRFDAVKFSHKVGAVVDAGLSQSEGILIWLDADTFTHSQVTHEWLNGLFPEPSYVAWLDRENCYPECGFIMMRCGHPMHRTIMETYRDLYVTDDVLKMKETHDSFVFQQLILSAVCKKQIEPPVSLSGEARVWSHPFVAGPLGSRLDHMKGDRKRRGKSHQWDLRRPRSEPYWKIA